MPNTAPDDDEADVFGPPPLPTTAASSSSSTAVTALQTVLQQLSEALVYTEPSNVDTNRKLWNQYARQWTTAAASPDSPPRLSPWVQRMARQVGRSDADVQFIGDEWSDEASLEASLSTFLFPLLSPDSVVAELGVGGGRVAARVAPRVSRLFCLDISTQMLSAAQRALAVHGAKCSFHLLSSPSSFPEELRGRVDVVVCFDVLPHVDLHTQRRYFDSLHSLLRPGGCGRVFLSVATITTPLGYERFSRQQHPTAGGFVFTSPDTVRALAAHTGWEIVHESAPDPSSANLYINRDYLFVMREKPRHTQSPS